MSYIHWIRGCVGQRKIFLVFSSVVVRDESGRILLQHRADFDVWGLPGGVLEINEDIETCARRELLEEAGITVPKLALVGVYTDPHYDLIYPNGDQVQQFTICFTGMIGDGCLRSDGVETRAHAFFTPEEMNGLTIPLWYHDMIRDALDGRIAAYLPPYANIQTFDQITNVRPFIGSARLITVGGMAAVERADGRLLMVHRRDTGGWSFPAGYCNLGENVAYTAVRETKEETGYHIKLERIIGIYSSHHFCHTFPNGDKVKDVGVLFHARLLGGEAAPEVDEINLLAWMTPAEVLAHAPVEYRFFFEAAVHYMNEGYFLV